MPRCSATSVACRPPAPPKDIRAKSRGSRPRSNRASLTDVDSFELTTSIMPFRRFFGRERKRLLRSVSQSHFLPLRRPAPCRLSGRRRDQDAPKTRLASVMVGRLPAAAIADRPRHCSCAFGSDSEPPGGVHAHDRPTSGADGAHIDHRYAHRVMSNLSGCDQRSAAVLDDGDIIARSSHVNRHDVRLIEVGGDAFLRPGRRPMGPTDQIDRRREGLLPACRRRHSIGRDKAGPSGRSPRDVAAVRRHSFE